MKTLADRLRYALGVRNKTAAELARAVPTTESTVSQWLTGQIKSMRGGNLIAVSAFLRIEPQWLSAGKGASGLEEFPVVAPAAREPAPHRQHPGGLLVPLLANAAAMGAGADQLEDDVLVGQLEVSPSWVTKNVKPLSRLDNLRFVHAYGDSMEPTFSHGDILLVDVGARSADIDGIYVLAANERLFVKRVTQRFDGVHEITSDNAQVKTVQILNGGHEVHVLGRVVYAWNGKKL